MCNDKYPNRGRNHSHPSILSFKPIRLHPLTQISELESSDFFFLFFPLSETFAWKRINRLTFRKMEHGVDKEGNKGSFIVGGRENLLLACLALNYTPPSYTIPFHPSFFTSFLYSWRLYKQATRRRASDSDPWTGTGESNALLPGAESSLREPATEQEISLWTGALLPHNETNSWDGREEKSERGVFPT